MFRFASCLYHSAPYPHWAYGHRPSRLLWFLIGAGTASLAMKSHAKAHCYDNERGWGWCRRVSVEGMGANANASFSANANPAANTPSPTAPFTASAPPTGVPADLRKAYEGWEKQQNERIEAEKAHIGNVSRQAVDKMVDLTEATLESVLTTAEALKVKLAEHRAEREKQQKLLEEQMDAQRRDPPRFV